MRRQRFVGDLIQLDANPSAAADVRRTVVGVRSLVDQGFLQSRRRWQPDRHVPIVMVRRNCRANGFFVVRIAGDVKVE